MPLDVNYCSEFICKIINLFSVFLLCIYLLDSFVRSFFFALHSCVFVSVYQQSCIFKYFIHSLFILCISSFTANLSFVCVCVFFLFFVLLLLFCLCVICLSACSICLSVCHSICLSFFWSYRFIFCLLFYFIFYFFYN